MLYDVRFKAVKRQDPKLLIYLLCVSAACLVVAIATCFIPAMHFLQRYAAIGIVVGLTIPNLFQLYKEIGECVLADDEIILVHGENIVRYPISEVTDIKFLEER